MALKRDAVLATAEKLLSKGKYDAALKEYLRLLQENPNDILVLNKVGDIYVLVNRPMDSLPHFTRIAEHYARDGFFLKAIAIYKKINKIDPSKLEVYNFLGDLYHKQGLVPEARAQYQILADHFLKQNKVHEAISVYRRMAAADPNDIKVPVRLADLLMSAGEADQALMQYGVIGSMLVKRGAVDEAVAVYQKALRIRPGDQKILHDLVRSMVDGGNADAAAQLLQSQPRNAETMFLLAEALQAGRNPAEARKAAEAAIAFDDAHDGARQFLARSLAADHDIAGSFEALRPVVDRLVRSGEIKKAVAALLPLADPDVPAVSEKLLELYRVSGDREKTIETLRGLAHHSWERGDRPDAERHYRQILELDPENSEARNRSGLAVAAPAPAPESDMVIEFDESLLDEEPAPAAPPPPVVSPPPRQPAEPSPGPALENTQVRRMRAEEAEWKDAITEAEVFAKYGLVEKAAEKYRQMLRRRPRDVGARQRLVELLAEIRSPALAGEASTLIEALREGGREDEAESARLRYLPATPPAVPLSEFELAPPAAPRPAAVPPPAAAIDFEDLPAAPPVRPPTPAPVPAEPSGSVAAAPEGAPASPPTVAPVDMEFAFDAGLGRALDDEMARFQETQSEPPPPAPAFDEMSLFSDERRFFDLAAELEKELDEEEAPEAPVLEGAGEEMSLEQIFREFKRGVEQQLSPEDYETHYNLGIAYKEMGLTDEAIGEFQIAAKDPARAVECCSMLGLCFVEKGLAQLAIQWFQKGLESPTITDAERWGLQYDLASVHEQAGDAGRAYELYLGIYGQNSNYRDVVARVKTLESSLGR
jgi:tetratricopeptide (TPR) repeat protein